MSRWLKLENGTSFKPVEMSNWTLQGQKIIYENSYIENEKVCYDFKEILSFSSKGIFFGSDKILILHPFKAAVYLNYRGKVVKKPIKIPTYQWEWGEGIDVCRSSFRYDRH